MVKVNVVISPGGIMKKIVIYKKPRWNGAIASITKWQYYPDTMKFPECDFIWLKQEQLDFIADIVNDNFNPNTYYKNKQEAI